MNDKLKIKHLLGKKELSKAQMKKLKGGSGIKKVKVKGS